MKNKIFQNKKLIIPVALFAMLLTLSCEYEKIGDVEYPEQLIYMPPARSGIFYIDQVALPTGSVPTPGNAYRYVVDLAGNNFNIPLAAYRSGINNDGAFKVDISVKNDTVTKLIEAGKLPADIKILESDKYFLPASSDMPDGEELAKFTLGVKLDYLLDNYSEGTVFAMGVSISSTARKTNPLYATTIIVINTKMMKPTASFTTKVEGLKVTFTNTSIMSLGYNWNFGDGSAASTEKSPIYTFSKAGTYTVSLSALGITGEQNKSVASAVISVQ
ncbi:MAG: PKD domain-containing protein [Mangrovibacterium sp.]